MKISGKAALLIGCAATLLPIFVRAAPIDGPIRPLPTDLKLDQRKIELGKKLFHDKRLSKDNKVACVSCHDLARGGADARPRSIGVGGAVGPVNSPSVYNSGFNFRQLWNGASSSLEDQVDRVIKNPKVFDSSWEEILGKLGRDTALVEEFQKSYPDGMNAQNVMDAIAIFERSLITPSRFDRYLRGDAHAITPEEEKGYEKFKNYGCVACHQGVNVGGNMFQVFGVMRDYFEKRGNVTGPDLGRFNVTKRESDKHVFKVPSLRNVELTAPYFHDASANTLEEAVDIMFKYQLGRTAPLEDKALIVRFLKTLTGERFTKAARPISATAVAEDAAIGHAKEGK